VAKDTLKLPLGNSVSEKGKKGGFGSSGSEKVADYHLSRPEELLGLGSWEPIWDSRVLSFRITRLTGELY
jgi:hypothetical protein